MRPLALALCLLGCESADQERPTAPRYDDVVAAYAQPTGTLNEESAPALLEAFAERIEDIETLLVLYGAVGTIPGAVADSEGSSENGLSVRRQGLKASAGAWAKVTRTCPEAGEIVAFALFDKDGLEETIWGEAKACALTESGVQSLFRGDLWLNVAGGDQGVIFLFDGLAIRDGVEAPLALDVQVLESQIWLRQPVGNTSFLVGVSTSDQGEDVSIRDAQGTWRCDTSACTGPDGQVVQR